MRPDDIHDVLRQRPFQPFRLHLSNGRTYDVRHPELVAVGRTTMFIGKPAPDLPAPTYDGYDIVALLQINDIELMPPAAPTGADGAGH
ncbi:MAG TPA: hypothetical protein VG013_09195 [Gemmataceae bacterium]|jgi:hypothetical protein|nr:hypothetical protein [Gemmataceae bacterium]